MQRRRRLQTLDPASAGAAQTDGAALATQEALEVAVRALAPLNLEALREAWRERVGSTPPPLRSPDHLRRLLAWRLQAEALGGLDPDTRRLLALSGAAAAAPQLPVGARVSREWRGDAHQVEITSQGVLYRGKLHRSLSEVARAITGVRWNGPRFFGLRSEGP